MSKTTPQSARSTGPNTDRTSGIRNRTEEATYVDEEGNVYQLADKGETKPIEVEHLPGTEKTELEVLLEASLKGGQANGKNGGAKRLLKKNRSSGRKQQASQDGTANPEARPPEAPAAVETSASTSNVAAPEDPVRLNLRQKLAEVRRRIGYVQKRGHNERFNYSYVTAADIAGSVGDILAELGVVVIPRLEDISYESAAGRGEATRMARVVMAYTFADVDSGEEVIAKVAGQGLDPGDKAPYKAMTGALKYALLQSFLLATGDDPEDERLDARFTHAEFRTPDQRRRGSRTRETDRRNRDRSRTGARVLQGRFTGGDDRNRLPARGRSAESQTGQTRQSGDRSCPGLSGCIRTLPNGTAGACKGLGPATLR